MSDLSPKAKAFLFTVYVAGAFILVWQLTRLKLDEPWMPVALCIAGSLASIFRVEGATNRSHYTINFLIYGFTFVLLGVPAALAVIAVSGLVEWIWRRPPWFIQVFNVACYGLALYAAGLVFSVIDPSGELKSAMAILAIAAAMSTYTILNHLMVGIIVWLARGENFQKSAIFDFMPLMIDMTLMTLGASLVMVWNQDPYGLILFALPLYLIYSTLRVPALERQTEMDSKTGLFNHAYFMQQVENELRRADRFDRPLTVVMADLDLLRNINNTYGHLAGDEVLIKIAAILKESVREYDVVARFGGEEFSILMPETSTQQAFERADKIRQTIEGTQFIISTSVTPISVTVSIGIAGRERFEQPSQEIIHNADTALYHSKLKGRNQTYVCANQAYASFLPEEAPETAHIIAPSVVHAVTASEQPGSDHYEAADSVLVRPVQAEEKPARQEALEDKPAAEPMEEGRGSQLRVNLFIGAVVAAALGAFAVAVLLSPIRPGGYSALEWLSLAIFAALVVLTEWSSIELYVKHTTISTSAVPILAGTLLFGPLGALILDATFAITAMIKYRSPFSRLLFNFGNQMIAAMVYTGMIALTGRGLTSWSVLVQLLLCLLAAFVVYLITTTLVAVGVGIDLQQSPRKVWNEQYGWLAAWYLGMGIVAYSLIFGYQYNHVLGIVLMVVPLLLLRMSQKQYVDRTRTMVSELHEKQTNLERTSEEIQALNDGLLDTLAEVIDLGDPYVLGHSIGVAELATRIASRMGLRPKQISLIRSASMVHDIGKLGISAQLLSKPGPLTAEEYEIVKKHVSLGAALLEKSPSLRALAPIIACHHEHFNGNGYPNRLRGREIPLEARIIAACDAIETMASDRPYRSAMPLDEIIGELKRCSGSQFDPLVVDAAVAVLSSGVVVPRPAGGRTVSALKAAGTGL